MKKGRLAQEHGAKQVMWRTLEEGYARALPGVARKKNKMDGHAPLVHSLVVDEDEVALASSTVLLASVPYRLDVHVSDSTGLSLPIDIVLIADRDFGVRVQFRVAAYLLLRRVQLAVEVR